MNRHEFSLFVVEVRRRWPDAPEWAATTIEAYFADLERYTAEDVAEALLGYYRAGRVKPPNGGQLLALIEKRRKDHRIESGPTPYDGPACTCAETWFWLCPMDDSRHGPNFMRRRREEYNAAKAVAHAVAQGRELLPDEAKQHSDLDLRLAIWFDWYGCKSGFVPPLANPAPTA